MEVSTPSTVSSRKRPSTASSPSKSAKRVPVMTIMQGLVTQLEIDSHKDEQTIQSISETMVAKFKQREEEAKQAKLAKMEARMVHIDRCLQLSMESGAAKNSEEYYVATELFRSGYNRHIFLKFDTNEERLNWLQRATRK